MCILRMASPREEVGEGFDFAGEEAPEQARLDFEHTAVGDAVVEDGVRDEGVHAALVGEDEFLAGAVVHGDARLRGG